MIERFNVSGALLSKIFGNPKSEEDLFKKRAGRVRDIGVSQAMYARFLFIALMLTASFATAIIYGWGGVMAVNGVINVGTVVALTAYLGRLYGPLTQLSNMNVDVMTALVSFERVFEVLDIKPLVADKEEPSIFLKDLPRLFLTTSISIFELLRKCHWLHLNLYQLLARLNRGKY